MSSFLSLIDWRRVLVAAPIAAAATAIPPIAGFIFGIFASQALYPDGAYLQFEAIFIVYGPVGIGIVLGFMILKATGRRLGLSIAKVSGRTNQTRLRLTAISAAVLSLLILLVAVRILGFGFEPGSRWAYATVTIASLFSAVPLYVAADRVITKPTKRGS